MTNQDADFKDFSSFMRFFCTRTIQAIVQARMGKMQPTACSPNPEQSNWFNLVIDEIGEVAAYLKSTIGKNYPPKGPVLSLEFILYTTDGDQLPLETWTIRIDKDCQDWSVNIRTTLYQQMTTLLKSMIVASRFTPAYRHYVKNQGTETFVIIYRVFEGEPDISVLGEEVKYRRLGYLPSPFGTVSVELHYRTKMEIQPQPFVEDEAEEASIKAQPKEIPIGIAVPPEGSQIVATSPTSMENINLFSTSPMSQDLPFRAKSPKIGRSYSSADAMDRNRPQPLPSSAKSEQQSPPTSSSFPQRNSIPKLRMRNNSFPFASLLICSQSSSDQLKTLPNVPEDAALNTAQITASRENMPTTGSGSNKGSTQELRRNSSIGLEMVGYSAADEQPGTSSQLDGQSRSPSKVLFRCSSENREEENPTPAKQSEGEGGKEAKERDDIDSDDSYVKVIGFASGSADEDLGSDLSEFFKEVRLAPDNLRSFNPEPTGNLEKQLDEFRQKESTFSQFITGLRERDGEEQEE